jgi:hypothetical protein
MKRHTVAVIADGTLGAIFVTGACLPAARIDAVLARVAAGGVATLGPGASVGTAKAAVAVLIGGAAGVVLAAIDAVAVDAAAVGAIPIVDALIASIAVGLADAVDADLIVSTLGSHRANLATGPVDTQSVEGTVVVEQTGLDDGTARPVAVTRVTARVTARVAPIVGAGASLPRDAAVEHAALSGGAVVSEDTLSLVAATVVADPSLTLVVSLAGLASGGARAGARVGTRAGIGLHAAPGLASASGGAIVGAIPGVALPTVVMLIVDVHEQAAEGEEAQTDDQNQFAKTFDDEHGVLLKENNSQFENSTLHCVSGSAHNGDVPVRFT